MLDSFGILSDFSNSFLINWMNNHGAVTYIQYPMSYTTFCYGIPVLEANVVGAAICKYHPQPYPLTRLDIAWNMSVGWSCIAIGY